LLSGRIFRIFKRGGLPVRKLLLFATAVLVTISIVEVAYGADAKDPLALLMTDKGFPVEPDVTKPESTLVFSFPMKAPEGSVMRDDRDAIEQLELWKIYAEHWCEHKPSITVYVKEDEWMEVGAWVYRNFDICSGVSFLPHTDHSYRQAPYQEITEEVYLSKLKEMPQDIDWTELTEYETDDFKLTWTHKVYGEGGVEDFKERITKNL